MGLRITGRIRGRARKAPRPRGVTPTTVRPGFRYGEPADLRHGEAVMSDTMKALVMRDGAIHLETADIPVPGPGQVLVKSLACGICGSDLHITRHADEVLDFYRKIGQMHTSVVADAGIMLGHEFCAEVVSYGPDTPNRLALGSRVTSVPLLMSAGGAGVGVTPGVAGAYCEYFLVDEQLLLPVPDHLPAAAAAVTEPLAVGLHAVNRSGIASGDIALVAGCGPIGLAVIAALHRRGIETIVASDLQSGKLETARAFGARHVVNPRCRDEVALAAELAGQGRVVIFECIGVHSLIDDFIRRAPAAASLVITGVHTATSSVNYAYATVKELDLKFSYYYTPKEFAECLNAIAEEELPWRLMLTGSVGIDGVASAFEALARPNDHIKVIVEPWRRGELESTRL